MQIPRIEVPEEKAQIRWRLPVSLIAELAEYRECYKENYGAEIDESRAVEEMLKSVMQKDKEFAKFKARKLVAARRQPVASADAGSGSATASTSEPEPPPQS